MRNDGNSNVTIREGVVRLAHSGPVAVCGTVATHVAMHLDELQVETRWFVNEIKHSPPRTVAVSRRKPLPPVTVLAVFFFPESRQDYKITNLEVKR